jgi:hypothetical protein
VFSRKQHQQRNKHETTGISALKNQRQTDEQIERGRKKKERNAEPYPVPVMATLKLNDVMLELIEDETVKVKVALTEAPVARLLTSLIPSQRYDPVSC